MSGHPAYAAIRAYYGSDGKPTGAALTDEQAQALISRVDLADIEIGSLRRQREMLLEHIDVLTSALAPLASHAMAGDSRKPQDVLRRVGFTIGQVMAAWEALHDSEMNRHLVDWNQEAADRRREEVKGDG